MNRINSTRQGTALASTRVYDWLVAGAGHEPQHIIWRRRLASRAAESMAGACCQRLAAQRVATTARQFRRKAHLKQRTQLQSSPRMQSLPRHACRQQAGSKQAASRQQAGSQSASSIMPAVQPCCQHSICPGCCMQRRHSPTHLYYARHDTQHGHPSGLHKRAKGSPLGAALEESNGGAIEQGCRQAGRQAWQAHSWHCSARTQWFQPACTA